jgi:hypothetical protein
MGDVTQKEGTIGEETEQQQLWEEKDRWKGLVVR